MKLRRPGRIRTLAVLPLAVSATLAMSAAPAARAAAGTASPAAADCEDGTDTWTGVGDGSSWADPENWTKGVPTDESAVVIGSLGGPTTYANITVCSLSMSESAKLSAPEDQLLTVTDITLSGDAFLNIAATVSGDFNWFGGWIAWSVTLEATAETYIDGLGDRTLIGTLDNLGTISIGSLGTTTIDGGTLTNKHVLRAYADAVVNGTTSIVNTSTGRIEVGDHALTIDGPSLLNSGVIALAGGTLQLEGGDHEFRLGTSIAGTGTVRTAPGATSDYDTGANLIAFGAVTMDPTITLEFGSSNLWGTLTPSAGKFHWTAGTISALVTIPAGVQARIDGVRTKDLHGHFINRGSLILGGGGPVELDETISNWATARVTGNTSLTAGGAFDNTSSGKLTIAGRTLTVDGPLFLASGTITLSNGGNLLLKEGSHEFRPGLEFLGSGTVRKLGPTGSVTGTGLVTLGSHVTWSFEGDGLYGKFTIGGGTFVWSGGTIVASLALTTGTAMKLLGSSAKVLHGSLINKGTVTWRRAPSLTIYDGQLTNMGRIGVEVAAKLVLSGGEETIVNKGTIALGSAGALTVAADTFTNRGALNLGTRKLAFTSGDQVLTSSSKVLLRVTRRAAGVFGRVTTTGRITLDGTLDITAFGTRPAAGATFKAVSCEQREDRFAHVVSHGGPTWRAVYQPKAVVAKAR